MSKKKPVNKTGAKKLIPAQRPGSDPAVKEIKPRKEKARAEFELIRFDRKVWIFIIACTVLFFLFTSLKLHNSSIPYWNGLIDDGGDPRRGLIAGEPLGIRSDEWLVYSSFILSQHVNGYPVSNEALGYGKSALLMGLPTVHLLSLLKPNLWGYYLLDIERGFSWQWNFKVFPFLISGFLFFMLFSKNNFLLSLFGSLWILLSSAVQWWSINTEIFTFGFLTIIALIYTLFSTKPMVIIMNGLLLLLSVYTLVMILYPAYLVPLAYFMLAVILGYIIQNKVKLKEKLFNEKIIKIFTVGGGLAAFFGLMYLFYYEASDTIQVMSNTVYPGKRLELGGNFSFLKLFSDNFSWFVNKDKFPPDWDNICELSSYLMLAPLASIMIIADWIKSKKSDPLLISILLFQIFIFIWLVIGFPEIVAKMSLLSTSPVKRTIFIFGFSNIILTILFLAHHRNSIIKNNVLHKGISFSLILILIFCINYFLNKQVDSFFSMGAVLISTIIITGINWCMVHFHEHARFRISFFAASFLFILPNVNNNPVSRGLGPYLENELYKIVKEINDSDPNYKWVVFGQMQMPNYIKAAGVNCFNGVKYAPLLEDLHVLDPTLANDSIYNRFAHIRFISLIDGRDSVHFELTDPPDLYKVDMDPCSPRFKQLNIKYIFFTYEPHPFETQCLTLVRDVGFGIYKRNDM